MWERGAGRLQRWGESGRSPYSRHVHLEESTRGMGAEGHKLRIVALHDRRGTVRVTVCMCWCPKSTAGNQQHRGAHTELHADTREDIAPICNYAYAECDTNTPRSDETRAPGTEGA